MHHTPSVCSFARVNRQKGSPGCITDAFGKMMILHHALDIQVFKDCLVKLPHQVQTRFVKEIQSLSLDLQMLLRQQNNGLSPAGASLVRSARNLTLRGLNSALGLTKQLRIFDYFTSRKSGKILNPNINASDISGFREPAGLILFDGEDDEPSIGFALDRAGLDRAFNRAAQADSATTNLRQIQLIAFQPEAGLGIAEGTEECLAFESWKAWCSPMLDTLKEGIKGLPQPLQRVLKHLAVDICYIFAHLLDCGKLKGLFVVVNRSLIDLPGIMAFLKPGVVKLTTDVQALRASGLKLRVHSDFELIRLHLEVVLDNR